MDLLLETPIYYGVFDLRWTVVSVGALYVPLKQIIVAFLEDSLLCSSFTYGSSRIDIRYYVRTLSARASARDRCIAVARNFSMQLEFLLKTIESASAATLNAP